MIKASLSVASLTLLVIFGVLTHVQSTSITYDSFGYVTASLYNYDEQGNDWSTNFSTCGGSEQSPVDMSGTTENCDASMVFSLQLSNSATFNIITNSSSLLEASGSFGQLYATDVNGNLAGYNATLWKLHAPSEHTIQGQSYDAELQIYFEIMNTFTPSDNRTQAAVSFLLSANTDQSSSVLAALNLGSNMSTTKVNMNFSSAIESNIPLSDSGNIVYFTYQGSETAPPCSEIINWYVISGSLSISSSDLAYMQSLWSANSAFANGNGNNRAIQNLNGRTILQGGDDCEEQFIYFFSFFILYIFINYFIFKLL